MHPFDDFSDRSWKNAYFSISWNSGLYGKETGEQRMERKDELNDNDQEMRSNERKPSIEGLIAKIYLHCNKRIERDFLCWLVDKNIPMIVKENMLTCYRAAMIDLLAEIERIFGVEGLQKISWRLNLCEDCADRLKGSDGEVAKEWDEQEAINKIQAWIESSDLFKGSDEDCLRNDSEVGCDTVKEEVERKEIRRPWKNFDPAYE